MPYEGKFKKLETFSVLIGTWDRIELLKKLISHYRKSPLVEKIFVTWHNPNAPVPEALLDLGRGDKTTKLPQARVEFLRKRTNSLNNRFNPVPRLKTKAVLIADDDVRVPLEDLHLAFNAWRLRPESLTGFFPRGHRRGVNGTWEYLLRQDERTPGYDMMLTKAMFIDADLLFSYTCLLPLSIHAYVDRMRNCEDIAFNMMASGLTGKILAYPLTLPLPLIPPCPGASPTAVMSKIDDFGTTKGISSASAHRNDRANCIADLITLFGRDTLVSNELVISRFDRVPYRKKNLDEW
ncbi:exostosin [Blyttiomyces helicus]|uniref:Exostosin n=1 Tax=Blyttiomyces helicus TaxID=388810 RepID=A0A4P9WFW4_9FUNG|nr:exostosin [Blyttiomyces helicus]|eukprot:RKO90228.1 exostosin [Blyttiomyces helicus]